MLQKVYQIEQVRRKYIWGLTIGGAVAFFRELEQEKILTKSTFYEEGKHLLST